MFEAIVMLCLAEPTTACRPVLLPGFEAADAAGCAERLAANPPDLNPFPGDAVPNCIPQGAALTMEEVAPGVFVHLGQIAEPHSDNRGDVANLGFVIGTRSVAVIDSGSARWMGEATYRAVRERTDLPISHLVLTHMHPDHVLGASLFADLGATVVGHAGLQRALADRQENYLESLAALIGPEAFIGTRSVGVDMPVQDTEQIDLGGRNLMLRAWPTAHTGVDLTAYDDQTGVLFTGDLVFDDHAPALDGSVLGWQTVLTQLAALPVRHIVPGHGGPLLDWPKGAEPMQRYLHVLTEDTRAAIAQGQRLGDAVQTIAESEAPNWHLFDAYNPRNATVAFTELEWE